MKHICHPELRNRIGTWVFQEQKGYSQDDNVRRRYLLIRCLPCYVEGATQIKFIFCNNSFLGKNSQYKFFQLVKREPSLELTGYQLPLAQNNPYAKVMHIGETVRIPTEPDCIRLHSCPVTQHLIHGYFVLLNTSMLNINIITQNR